MGWMEKHEEQLEKQAAWHKNVVFANHDEITVQRWIRLPQSLFPNPSSSSITSRSHFIVFISSESPWHTDDMVANGDWLLCYEDLPVIN